MPLLLVIALLVLFAVNLAVHRHRARPPVPEPDWVEYLRWELEHR